MKAHGLKLFLHTRSVRYDWQLFFVRVNSLITHLQLLQVKKMSVMYESAHVAIPLQ